LDGRQFLEIRRAINAKRFACRCARISRAVCAKAVFISVGSLQVEGGWIDAKGNFLGGVGAGPVYKLLGKKDLGTSDFPQQERRSSPAT